MRGRVRSRRAGCFLLLLLSLRPIIAPGCGAGVHTPEEVLFCGLERCQKDSRRCVCAGWR